MFRCLACPLRDPKCTNQQPDHVYAFTHPCADGIACPQFEWKGKAAWMQSMKIDQSKFAPKLAPDQAKVHLALNSHDLVSLPFCANPVCAPRKLNLSTLTHHFLCDRRPALAQSFCRTMPPIAYRTVTCVQRRLSARTFATPNTWSGICTPVPTARNAKRATRRPRATSPDACITCSTRTHAKRLPLVSIKHRTTASCTRTRRYESATPLEIVSAHSRCFVCL